jgi:hypothetical protein
VVRLTQALPAYAEELRLAYRYIGSDPGSSLTKARIVLERLAIRVYTAEMRGEPKKPLLGDILSDNQFTRKLERRIVSRMNSIRDMGNLGPHGERVDPKDAARVLDDLCDVLDWHLQRYGEGPAGTQQQAGAIRAHRPGASPVVKRVLLLAGLVLLSSGLGTLTLLPSAGEGEYVAVGLIFLVAGAGCLLASWVVQINIRTDNREP